MDWSFTLKIVILGSTLLGAFGGVLGSFTVLRRQSLLGDALAHAALPGVCLAFLVTGEKSPVGLLVGAMLAGLVGALVILGVVRWSRVKEDSAIGIVLSVFFGLGIVLLTRIQKMPFGNQSGLDQFLFGQAATLLPLDVVLIAVVGGSAMVVVALLYKELKLLTFDRDFGQSLGFSMRWLEIVFTVLLVAVVVVGLKTVGVVLMIATLINPAAAARQWTDRLGAMVGLAALIGGVSAASGSLLSASVSRLPTGPTIVLASSAVLAFSLLCAPRRGLVWGFLRERQVAERIRRENLLKDLYRIGEAREDWSEAVPWPVVMGVRGRSGGELASIAARLVRRGLLERIGNGLRLTAQGLVDAESVVRKHRLWELYLTRRLELASDHVHRDAEAMEHALTEQAVAELEERLGHPTVDPHGRPIPPRRDRGRVA